MRARNVIVIVVLAGLALFAAVNWSVFTGPTRLNLVVAQVEAPLGLTMLGVTAGLSVLYLVFVGWLETTALLEARRHARELQAQRQLAESAETSRYVELRQFLEAELRATREGSRQAVAELTARADRLEESLRAEVERAGNTLAAYIGELEDRILRGGAGGPRPA
jgi:uncharacterized integral membrane protein